MARGGRRPNAGRSKALNFEEELWIYGECLRHQNTRREQREQAAIAAHFTKIARSPFGKLEGLNMAVLDQLRIDRAKMKAWTASQRRAVDDEDSDQADVFGDVQMTTALLGGATAMRKGFPRIGPKPEWAENLHRIAIPKLRGHRQEIIKLVASDASNRLGKRVSPRTVRSIWESFPLD